MTSSRHFNPRTPHGVRRLEGWQESCEKTISIHAPLTGCDPTTMTISKLSTIFQSTHPSRGATTGFRIGTTTRTYFNPRTPHGVRQIFSMFTSIYNNFNPRTPHGVRPGLEKATSSWSLFQSTHPSRGATIFTGKFMDSGQFQSTHPSRGATTGRSLALQTFPFQSTHPSRGATIPRNINYAFIPISIHAPLTGCDLIEISPLYGGLYFNPRTPHGVRQSLSTVDNPNFLFQSTHPSRGATTDDGDFSTPFFISIHAPLTGCDMATDPPI